MKKILSPAAVLLCMVLLLLTLSGCQNEKGFPIPVSDTTRSVFELSTKTYKDRELEEIYEKMTHSKDINLLNSSYLVECLRKDDDGYRVIYVGKNKLLVLCFDPDGKWQERTKLESLYYASRTRSVFEKLHKGDPVSSVQYADPMGFYPFLLDREGCALESDHYSQDGYHTHITYDKDLKIVSIEHDVA